MLRFYIIELKTDILDGITSVEWKAYLPDSEHKAYQYGICNYQPNRNSENFKNFEDLSETEIENWVRVKLGKAKINKLTKNINKIIKQQKKTKTLAKKVPWGLDPIEAMKGNSNENEGI